MTMTSAGKTRLLGAALLAAMALAFGLQATPASACVRVPAVADVDQALAGARLSNAQAERVRALRNRIAEQVGRGDYRAASVTEGQAMGIMGLEFEDYGQIVRGGCNGRWVRRQG